MNKNLKVELYNVVEETTKTYCFKNINIKDMTLYDLKKLVLSRENIPDTDPYIITFCNYYIDFEDKMFYQETIPYAIVKNKILFNVPYEKCLLTDFLANNNINNEIKIEYGYPACGGYGINPDLWSSLFDYLKTGLSVLSVFGDVYGAYSFIKDIRNKLKEEKQNDTSPMNYFEFILSRDLWNRYRLAELLNLDLDKTEKLLIICGYTRHGDEYSILGTEKEKRIKLFNDFVLYLHTHEQ